MGIYKQHGDISDSKELSGILNTASTEISSRWMLGMSVMLALKVILSIVKKSN